MLDNKAILDHFFKEEFRPEEKPNVSIEATPLDNADELVLIIDRSGSMMAIQSDAEGGVNSFIKEQKTVGEANLTLVEFDHRYNKVFDRVPLVAITEDYKLRPAGSTALLDAIGLTLGDMRGVVTTGKKIAVVVTDGQENCSKEWNRTSVFELITSLKEEGWEFIFLAADESTIRDAAKYGFGLDTSVHYNSSIAGSSQASYASAGAFTTSYRTGKTKLESIADMDKFVDDNASIRKLS